MHVIDMGKDTGKRQYSFYKHLSTMHMFCMFILMLGFIEYRHSTFIYLFAFLSLAGLGTVLFLNSSSFHNIKEGQFLDNSAPGLRVKLFYMVFPFLVVLTLYCLKDNGVLLETLFVLPVLFTSTVIGKKASYAMSTVCTLILVYTPELTLNSLVTALESNIFIIGAMYAVGWFVGGMMDIEAQHRKQLRQSVLDLKAEINRREQMEKEIARLDRLNMIGEMAAGIGHEIRNPMTTVRGFLQLLQGRDKYAGDREFFDLMIEELDRANSIIAEFLSLAKNKAVVLTEHDLNSIINNIYPLIVADAMISDKNTIKELGEIPLLYLDEKEIRQLILNLVRNGLEAMSPNGVLTLRTFIDGEEAVLAVKDEGSGIALDILEKIGTPFFTTKENGTGLGLAVCYSIAARHNAVIKVETAATGTTFYVRFKLPGINQ